MVRRRIRTCGSCGARLPARAAYCPGCGRPAVAPLHPLLLAGGWLVVGLLVAATVTALISLPPLALLTAPPAVVLGRAFERRDHGGGAVRWVATVGVAALPLLLAYLNRHGPGSYCHAIGSARYPGTECGDQWDPRPFLAVGLALLLAPALAIPLALRRRRR